MAERMQPARPSLKKLGPVPRRALNVSPGALVKFGELSPGQKLPLVIEPAVEGVDLYGWLTAHKEDIEARLLDHGGLLFRGFDLATMEDFERFLGSLGASLLQYRERSSPRTEVGKDVYTSTDHPADQRIYLHNENSYAASWPQKIFFFCHTASETGGETPIADVRRVYRRIDPAIRRRFAERGVLYVRNFTQGIGLPWETVFQTSDKSQVEAYAKAGGYQVEWKPNGLRTRRQGPAVAKHPVTGEMLWFNHGTFFHISTLEPAVRSALLAQFAEEDLPNNTYYGDGSPIEPEVMDHLRAAYDAETIAFPWQVGDVLLLDNMSVAHSRSPFTGQRKILTAMSEPMERGKLAPIDPAAVGMPDSEPLA